MPDTLSPEQLKNEGENAYRRKDYQNAAQAFQAAAAGYDSQGDLNSAAEMKNNASVAWLQSGEGSAALASVLGSDETFAQVGDSLRQAMAIGNQAAALDALGRNEEAAQAYERSAILLKELGEMDLYANTLQSLSAIQLRMGRQLEALASMQAGLEGLQKPSAHQRLARKLLKSPFSLLGR